MLESDELVDKELAQQVSYILRDCYGLLDHTVWLVKRHGSEEELPKYRRAVAIVFAELLEQLLDPIYMEYPDLDPNSPTSSKDHEGQSSEQKPQVENHPDLPEPGDPKP